MPMDELKLDAAIENLPEVTEFVTASLEEIDCPFKIVMQIELVIEEIFMNVASYAYAPDKGLVTVQKSFDEEPRALNLIFIDSGKPYNPLEHKDPDTSLGVDEREIGGLGIFLIKKNVDSISYERRDGQNILSIKKFF